MSSNANSIVLRIEQLRKQFEGQPEPLLKIDALSLQAGGAYSLTGLNGAGKSTLLRIMAGLESAQQGTLHYHDEQVSCAALPAQYAQHWRRSILYVHQQPYMLRGSVESNVAYGLKQWHTTAEQLNENVNAALQWAQLAPLRARDAKLLSGGEKQRVALARAHALQPRLWLLDEPTANLDGASREQVIALIAKLTQSGATVVIATHDRDLMERAALTRLKLQDGEISLKA